MRGPSLVETRFEKTGLSEQFAPLHDSQPKGSLTGATAIILAGGLGTRLRSAVRDRPKVLAETCGRPFLSRLLDQLAAAGMGRAVLCTGYLGEQVEAAFGGTYGGLRLVYSRETAPLGTAGALRAALPLVSCDPLLVMNGDSYYQLDLAAFWACHQARPARATMALARVPDTRRFGRVSVDEDGRVLAFEEKGVGGGPGWINAGVYVLGRDLLRTIPAQGAVSLERQCFPSWIGGGLYAYPGEGAFLDIGTPESYAAAEEFFSSFQ